MIFPFHILQAQDTIQTESGFYLFIKNAELKVVNNENEIIFSKTYQNPVSYTADLDDDGIDEFLVRDSLYRNSKPFFILYLFNSRESFSFIDSILSGSVEPYITSSGDLGGTIIFTGNPEFDHFNTDNQTIFLPIDCWRYEESSVFLVNDEIYNIFLAENESILNYLDEYLTDKKDDCPASSDLKAAIAAAYANYINAGEFSIASQFLKNYYLCDDINEFRIQLHKLLKVNE